MISLKDKVDQVLRPKNHSIALQILIDTYPGFSNHKMIVSAVYGEDVQKSLDNSMSSAYAGVLMNRLRQLLGVRYIINLRGYGYRLSDEFMQEYKSSPDAP